MSKKIYSTIKVCHGNFKLSDSTGAYLEVSDEDFNSLLNENLIYEKNGNYYTETSGDFFDESGALNYTAKSSGSLPEMPELYANPGKTCKTIAKFVCIWGIILSVIGGIIGWIDGDFLTFLLVALGGSIVSYFSGLGLALLGDIAMNINEINRKIK